MGRILLVVLAACGSAPPLAPPLENVAPAAAHVPSTSPCGSGNFTKREGIESKALTPRRPTSS